MDKQKNYKEEHMKYENFKMHQHIYSSLQKGDVVELRINGEIKFTCEVLYGNNAHVNISLQDKGAKSVELTEEQKLEALREYRERNNL